MIILKRSNLFIAKFQRKIPLGVVLKMHNPVNCHVNVVVNDVEDEKLKKCYTGDLTYLSEEDIKKLRRLFHFVSTKEPREKRQSEVDEFKKKNREVLEQMKNEAA